ncbi:T9SS type A sorting domain-containing protein [Flavobacteriaceae bacterium LMO-SS05]
MKKLILFVCVISWSYNTNAQCDSTLPIFEKFDTNNIGVCWQVDDKDGDGFNWYWRDYGTYYGGYKCLTSRSWSSSQGDLNPDNWVYSYAIDLTSFNTNDNIELSWKVRGELNSLAHEYYAVYAATSIDPIDKTSTFKSSPVQRGEYADEVGADGVFVTRTMNISALAGNMAYIAFQHKNISGSQFIINIDDVQITTGTSNGGCNSDSDGDGVCDSYDRCPGHDDTMDTDGDGVPDGCDICPGYDDAVDSNGNGIPDGCEELPSCVETTTNFSSNVLVHSGTGSNTTTLTLPSDSQNISFTISGIDEKIKGKESGKYIERITVTYKDGSGTTRQKGIYRGDQLSAATINFPDNTQSIILKLDDAYDGNTSSTLSVNLSTVTYCGSSSPCTDSDGDGVCDVDDQCPGFDDTIDANGNGIPDGCESACVEYTANFSKNPLTHSGSASSSTTLSLPTNSKDVSFTITNINSKTKGKPSGQYTERVIVSYIDGSGASITYGTYTGSSVSSASVNINGTVRSITVNLTDVLTGNTSTTLSINFSAVTYCISSSSTQTSSSTSKEAYTQQGIESLSKSDELIEDSFKIFPNPASQKLFVKSTQIDDSQANLALYNLNGLQVRRYNLNTSYNQTHELDINGLPTGIYILHIISKNGSLLKTDRVIIK